MKPHNIFNNIVELALTAKNTSFEN